MKHNDEVEGGGASRSTDPAAGSSSSTDVSLREFLMAQIVASREECRAGLRHLEESVKQAEVSSNEAVDKALASIDKRFDGVNEFRGALTDLSNKMATKDQLEALADKVTSADAALERRFEALWQRNRDDIDGILTRLNIREGADSGSRVTKGSLYTAAGIVIAALGLLVVIANYFSSH